MNTEKNDAVCHQYEVTIPIEETRERVWRAFFEETNSWWLPDFHVVDASSNVSFDVSPGGCGLVERIADGAWLQWYTVQMFLPEQFKAYLVGHIFPEWGGPATSYLRIVLLDAESGCVLQVTDARNGNVDEKQVESYVDGWTQLFTDGLKKFVENDG